MTITVLLPGGSRLRAQARLQDVLDAALAEAARLGLDADQAEVFVASRLDGRTR